MAGIPDLRLEAPAWIDFDLDHARAVEIAEATSDDDVEGSIRLVFERRAGWNRDLVERRIKQVLDSRARLAGELDGWLAPLLVTDGPVLDIGCGPGTLLAALGRKGQPTIGIDVSMEWLVVAKRMSRAAGVEALIACASGEALPLRDGAAGAVALLDVVEHVGSARALVEEADRALREGGSLVLATPNRFSLAAEPHVGVWGVGWLPRALQERYVQRRTRLPYEFVRLLGRRELRRMFERHSCVRASVRPAPISLSELATFSSRRRILAHAYNRLVSVPAVSSLLAPVCPFFHLTGVRGAGERRPERRHSTSEDDRSRAA